jgi:phosphatidylinositol glycan class W
MDMGVGAFVFSHGIVSATPIIQWIKYPAHLRPPLTSEIKSALEKTLPVLALGLIRVALVKSTEYPVSAIYVRSLFEFDTLMMV